MILTMTETEEILRTTPILVEGKSLTEWVALNTKQMEKTESYKYALDFFQRKDERVIAEMEAIIKDPKTEDGESKEPRYNTKAWAKRRIAQIAEQTAEEQATENLAEVIASLHLAHEKHGGVLLTDALGGWDGSMSPKEGSLALGYAALEKAGWKKCEIEYSGGHDSGGIDEIIITRNNGSKEELTSWQDFEKILEPANMPTLCPSSGFPEPEILYEIDDEGIQMPMFYIEVKNHNYHPCNIRITTYNALTNPITQTFGSWAGDFNAQGTLVWDLDNKDEELYLEYEISEYKSQKEPVQ